MARVDIAVWLRDPNIECWNFRERHAARLLAVPGVELRVCEDREEFLESLPTARVALAWRFEEEWLPRAPRLDWLVTPAAGRDTFDVRPPRGVDVEYGSFHGKIIGETVLAFLLGHSRGVRDTLELQETHSWPRALLAPRLRRLRGSRLTVLGFGRIGRWIGRLAKPFGVRIAGVKRRPASRPDYFGPEDRIVLREDLDGVLPETDFLVVCLPRSPETDLLVDRRRLDLLSREAVVINVGRGNAVDEDALASQLSRGELAAAYLDVYREEPLPEDSPLRDCPNVLLMPHASAISPDYMDLFTEELVEKLEVRYGDELQGA